MNLYETIGTAAYENLLADPKGADPISINVKPVATALEIGQLMYRNASGFYEAAAAAQITASNDIVVLGEAAGGDADATVAEVALSYRAGTFIDGKVFVTKGTALTAAQKVVLRQFGIVFDVDTEAATFNNAVE